MNQGITAYSSYVPAHRINMKELGDAHGKALDNKSRVIASFDEDSTTMGVEAGRAVLKHGAAPNALYFATTTPVYADKTNATALHAALDLSSYCHASDLGASSRGAVTALRICAMNGGLAVMSDIRVGRPGSSDEINGADSAAAFLFAEPDSNTELIAELLGVGSITAEFLDRWREPGSFNGSEWEERFGLSQYVPLIHEAASQALKKADLNEVDHVVLVSPNSAVNKQSTKLIRGTKTTRGPVLGFSGASDIGLALADVLDRSAAGETIMVISAADGADAFIFRTTETLAHRRQERRVSEQLRGGRTISYAKYLGWRNIIQPQLPRRPEPDRPAAPPSLRSVRWKFGFEGSQCKDCSMVHLPPALVCKNCASNRMDAASIAKGGGRGTVATFTVDRLAYSPSPPVINAVVDFDAGGRYTLEVADADPEEIEVGTRVELVFRALFKAGGVSDYFWKARIVQPEVRREEGL